MFRALCILKTDRWGYHRLGASGVRNHSSRRRAGRHRLRWTKVQSAGPVKVD
jgi:hypothetical protein